MDKFYMSYSDKNIPIPSRQDYKIHLLSKTEKFIKRIRWKALEFPGKLESTEKETYGFKSRKLSAHGWRSSQFRTWPYDDDQEYPAYKHQQRFSNKTEKWYFRHPEMWRGFYTSR